ncbi:MAG: cysteine desulfurase family protein [Micropepsaceae bacterium]
MRVYLDHNATSPLRPEARAAMLAALDAPGNALSVHADGRRARATIDAARRAVAAAVNANTDDVIFTSGGSEANALALRGAVQAAAAAGERITRLIISAIEHDSVRATAALCEETVPGLRVLVCPVTASGVVDLDELRRMLSEGKGRALVSVMAANNETGVVQPVAEAAKIAHAHGALMHSDAVQAVGKIAVDAKDIDYVTFNAHKFGGPQGVGALVVRQGAPLAPQIRGGGQEFGRRAGTENVAAIAGFGAAVEAAQRPRLNAAWRSALERKLLGAASQAVVFGADVERLPNTVCMAAPGVPSENMVIALDLDGFSVSAGAACSSGKVTQSHVLSAMGVAPALAACAIRVSFGWNTTEQELALFADAWIKIVRRAQARAAA